MYIYISNPFIDGIYRWDTNQFSTGIPLLSNSTQKNTYFFSAWNSGRFPREWSDGWQQHLAVGRDEICAGRDEHQVSA